jgi:adenosylcobinamide-GDP ribazoletransferase
MTRAMASVFDDVRGCLRFYSRLPVRAVNGDHAMPDFARISWATPIAGAIIGAIAAGVVVAAKIAHLPTVVAAAMSVSTLMLVTGGLHEDGLADVADGFGGGATREQKLAIMRDSRVGTYGALALCMSVLLRVAAVTAALERGVFLTALALVAASALSRAVGLIPLVTLLPARHDGAGFSARTPSPSAMRLALYIGGALSLAPAFGGASLGQTVAGGVAAAAGALGMAKLAERQIGGYTGDVLGAAQQIAEIAVLLAISAS